MATTTTLSPVRVRSAPSLEDGVEHLGNLKARQAELIADRDRRLAEIQAEYTGDVEALDEAIDAQLDRIGRYVDANRESLFGKRKSVQLEAGKIAVRAGRTVAKIDDEDAAIEALKGRRGKVAACLVTTPKLSRTELAKQQPDIPGVTYETARERISVTPTALGSAISAELPS